MYHRTCVSLAEAGYDVHLIARDPAPKAYAKGNVTVHPLPDYRNRLERLARNRYIARIASELRPDLYHVHEPELLGPVLSRAKGRPVVWDVHECYLDVLLDRAWIPRPLRPAARLAWDLLERSLVRRCAAVVAATDHVAERYRPLHGRVVVVANYPKLSEIAPDRQAPRDGTRFVYTGAISPNRGLLQAVQAVGLARERGLKVRLDVAGPAEEGYMQLVLREALRLGVADQLTCHGMLPRAQVLELQRSADVGLIPHLPYGNNLAAWPVKMLEFMASGLPVLYSDLPSHREVAGDAVIGVTIDPENTDSTAEAMRALVENATLRRSMGLAGKERVRARLNWEVERAKLLSTYAEILPSPE